MLILIVLFGSAYQIMQITQISDIEVTHCEPSKAQTNVKYELRNLSRHNFKLLKLWPHFYKLKFERARL